MDHVAAHLAEADESDLHLELLEVLDVDSHGGQPVAAERLEVAVGLGADERAKGVGLAGDLEVLRGLVDDLQEAAALAPALVELPRRVQEARPVAPRRRDVVLALDDLAD